MVQQRPGLMAFPRGDIMRRTATPYSSVTIANGQTRTTPASTITESMIGAPGSGIPAATFGQNMARQAAARRMLEQATAQRQQREQQQQMDGPFLPARPEGMPGISPRGRGALAGALAGLQYAGPQTQPTSFAQGLGVMGQAAMEAYTKAEEARRARELEDRAYGLKLAELGAPDLTTLEKNLRAQGLVPGTPEYQEAVARYLSKSTAPSVTVDMGAGSSEFKKEATKYAFNRRRDEDKNIAAMGVLENELDTIQNLIKGGAETGRIANALIPVQQLLAEAGLVGEDEMGELSEKELLQRSIARIIPNMRVAGSGSTSDYEMRMFAMAAPTFARTSEGNRKIAAGMLQGIRYVKERRALMDEFMGDKNLGDGTLEGFDKWADGKQGKVFQSFNADDPDALDAYKKAYQDGQIKVGDLIFNGQTYTFVTKESVEGF